MATLHDLTRASLDALAERLADRASAGDAAAHPAIGARVARRRRAHRQRAAAAVTVALLAAAGAGWAWGPSLVPDTTAQPSPTASAVESVTLPVTASTLWSSGLGSDLPGCGDPLPEPLRSAHGFTLDVTPTPGTGSTPQGGFLPSWTGLLTYTGEPRNAVVDRGFPVVARDGEIVAVGYGTSQDGWLRYFADGGALGVSSQGADLYAMSWCSMNVLVDDPAAEVAEPGDYQVAWVASVRVTPEDVALQQLTDAGYSVAPAQREYPESYPIDERTQQIWQPGSVDCLRALDDIATYGGGPGMLPPVQCVSERPTGVSIDPETGAVTVPYDAAAATDPFRVVFASEPVAAHLDRALTWGDLGYYGGSESWQPEPVVLECGADAEGAFGAPAIGFSMTHRADPRDILKGSRVPLLVDFPQLEGDGEATATLPDGAEVWIAHGYATAHGNQSGESSLAWIAHGVARFSPSSTPIHRATGYPDVEWRVEDLTYCDGFSAASPEADDPGLWAYVVGPATASWDSGRVDEFEAVQIGSPWQ